MFSEGLLRGKRILVTGGGSGLGRSIAARYMSLGADVTICGRRLEMLEATTDELAAENPQGSIKAIACNVRDAAAIDAMMDAIWQDGPLDVLVNNAAGNFVAQTERLSANAIDTVLETVLHGSAYCTVAAGRRWIDGKRPGLVLSIISLSAQMGSAFTAPSAMAKAGVLAMTRSLAVEWGRKGIRLNAVAPGPFKTEGAWERLFPEPEKIEPVERVVPVGRLGHHHELTNLCAFLASDGGAYITGECIVVDGGKQWLGGGTPAREMLDWSDAEWQAVRNRRASAAAG